MKKNPGYWQKYPETQTTPKKPRSSGKKPSCGNTACRRFRVQPSSNQTKISAKINKKCYIRTRNRPVFILNCSGVTESRDAAWRVLLAYVSRARQAASRDLVTPPWLYNRKFHRGDHWFQLWSRYPYRYKLGNKNRKHIVKGTPRLTIIATEIRYGIQKFRNRSVLVVGPHHVVCVAMQPKGLLTCILPFWYSVQYIVVT